MLQFAYKRKSELVPASPFDPLWTIEQLAAYLKMSPRAVFCLRSQGRLPEPIRVGRSIRFKAEEIQAWTRAGAPDLVNWESMKRVGNLEF